MYTLTVYCGYRWFYCFCLLTSQLVCMDDFLPLLYVCSLFISELFHFIIFLFLIVAFSFLLRELPLVSAIKLVWWCWNLYLLLVYKASEFSIKSEWESCWVSLFIDFFHHFKCIMPFFSGLQNFCSKISRQSYGSSLVCYSFSLVAVNIFSIFNYCQFDSYVSWCAPLWVSPI